MKGVSEQGQFIYCPFIVGVSDVKKDERTKNKLNKKKKRKTYFCFFC